MFQSLYLVLSEYILNETEMKLWNVTNLVLKGEHYSYRFKILQSLWNRVNMITNMFNALLKFLGKSSYTVFVRIHLRKRYNFYSRFLVHCYVQTKASGNGHSQRSLCREILLGISFKRQITFHFYYFHTFCWYNKELTTK